MPRIGWKSVTITDEDYDLLKVARVKLGALSLSDTIHILVRSYLNIPPYSYRTLQEETE